MLYHLSYASELLPYDTAILTDKVPLGRIESETQDKNEKVT